MNIEHITSRAADLGDGLLVHRALPTRQRRMVGAWCFLDHAGPVHFGGNDAMHVGAHPHIGLQTFTWLIEGAILHRDSLGNEQVIQPGAVNLMTAGHGIVHTEDSLPDSPHLHAAQLWIALPPTMSDCAPAFEHYPDLPQWTQDGYQFTLLAGAYATYNAPATFHSPLVGLDIHNDAEASTSLTLLPEFEYAILPLEGELNIEGERFVENEFAYLGKNRHQVQLDCRAGSRVLVIGGEPFEEEILMWWNFVGFSKEQIAVAQHEWETGAPRFGIVNDIKERRLVAPALPWAGY